MDLRWQWNASAYGRVMRNKLLIFLFVFAALLGFDVQAVNDPGEELYDNLCESCHGDGNGGVGPILYKNEKLLSAPYVGMVVMRGVGAMPGFGDILGDMDIMVISNYVRKQFLGVEDNSLTIDDVHELRIHSDNGNKGDVDGGGGNMDVIF